MLEVSLAKWLRVAAAGLPVLAFTPATTLAKIRAKSLAEKGSG